MKKITVLFLIGLLFVGGCGTAKQADTDINESTQGEVSGQGEASIQEDVNTQDEASGQGEANAQEESVQEDTAETENEASFFAELPDEFIFSSGAGGWATELNLQDDGTFHGQYHDSDMGSIGEDYPNGTQYISRFEGKFAEPVQVSEYVYSTTIEYMNADSSGGEYIEDGIRYIVCEPYGLENAGEILFYMYGASHTELPEGFLSWVMGEERGFDSIRCYGIYNVNEENGFTGVKYEAYEEICKLNGSYQNEAGDRVDIQLSSELDEYSYELGSVQWMPHDGVAERGAIVKNAKGGFTICLEDSIQYNFEMTNYETGKIEFAGADKWSEQFGTFVMQ